MTSAAILGRDRWARRAGKAAALRIARLRLRLAFELREDVAGGLVRYAPKGFAARKWVSSLAKGEAPLEHLAGRAGPRVGERSEAAMRLPTARAPTGVRTR